MTIPDDTLEYGPEGPPSHPKQGTPINAATHAFLVVVGEELKKIRVAWQESLEEVRRARAAWETVAAALARLIVWVGWLLVGGALGTVVVGFAGAIGVVVFLAVR